MQSRYRPLTSQAHAGKGKSSHDFGTGLKELRPLSNEELDDRGDEVRQAKRDNGYGDLTQLAAIVRSRRISVDGGVYLKSLEKGQTRDGS